ncbi:MAG: tryptophan-rich sensory protein [Nanoarchaeota archaeon]|nr:tryptophan-rich sensory protein [Nanoarchaeota archaeon]MBU1704684.1 tryptophan-rich sensory protein [Nanoarchaeota archaeon]
MKNAWKLLISIAITFCASAIGGLFTASSVAGWYASLDKPVFNPPNWLFGPVWTVLYLLIGISFYLIWRSNTKSLKKSSTIFGIQLSLNVLWSIIFFGLKMPWFAFGGIILLIVAISINILDFYKTDKKAAYLLIPYLLWVIFASVLNLAIAILN